MISLSEARTELGICNKNREKGGCKWGECAYCGVPNLLIKLSTNILVEDNIEVGVAQAMIIEIQESFIKKGLNNG